METFGNFLVRRFHQEGISHPGKFKSLVEFGKWLGVKQSTFSTWCNDSKVPQDSTTIDRLASKLGVEVYDILGVARRMPNNPKLNLIATIWDRIPEDKQEAWYHEALEIQEKEGRNGNRQKSRTS